MNNKNIIEYCGNYDGLEKSLKVIDFMITLVGEPMTVKEATNILEDAIRVLPQLTLLQ